MHGAANGCLRFVLSCAEIAASETPSRCRTQKGTKERKTAQISVEERKCKYAFEHKRAELSTNEHKERFQKKKGKQPGLKQPGLGTLTI